MSDVRHRVWGRGARVAAVAALLLLAAAVPVAADEETRAGAGVAAASDRDPAALWGDANRAFREGRFDEALAHYTELEERVEGRPPVPLWYNLGTTYARLGDAPRAALYFRRVLAFEPMHADAQANLKRLDLPAIPEGRPSSLCGVRGGMDRWVSFLPRPAWTGSALTLWALAVVLNIVGRLRSTRLLKRAAVVVAAGALAATIPAAWTCYANDCLASATVLQDARARSGPGETFKEIYEVKAGQTIWLARRRSTDGYTAVHLPNDLVGFVPADHLARHIPRVKRQPN